MLARRIRTVISAGISWLFSRPKSIVRYSGVPELRNRIVSWEEGQRDHGVCFESQMVEILSSSSRLLKGMEWQVRRGLCWINPEDLKGLASVRIEDEMPEFTGVLPEWAIRFGATPENVYGWYAPAKIGNDAYIMLYARNIYRGVQSCLRLTPVATLRIVRTLAHEIAHHLMAQRGYVFTPADWNQDDEEQLANRYSEIVLKRMTRKLSFRLSEKIVKEIASWHYALGSADWKYNNFESAARHFYLAWDLDRAHKEASYWYGRAREKNSEINASTR